MMYLPRSRTKYSAKQLDILEAAFLKSHYPDTEILENLSCTCDVSVDRVSVWFQNRRSKFRRQSKGKHMNWMRSQIFDLSPESETRHVLSPPSESAPWSHSPNLPNYSLELSLAGSRTGPLPGDPNWSSSSLCATKTIAPTGINRPSHSPHPGATLLISHFWGTRHENSSNVDCIPRGHLQPYMQTLPLFSDAYVPRHMDKRKPSIGYDTSRTSTNPLTLGHLMNDLPTVRKCGERASKSGMLSYHTNPPSSEHRLDTNVSPKCESLRPHSMSQDTEYSRNQKPSERCQVDGPAISSLSLSHPGQCLPRSSTPVTCPNVGILYDPFFIR